MAQTRSATNGTSVAQVISSIALQIDAVSVCSGHMLYLHLSYYPTCICDNQEYSCQQLYIFARERKKNFKIILDYHIYCKQTKLTFHYA